MKKMETNFRVPVFVPITQIYSSIGSAFSPDNQIRSLQYMNTDIFGAYRQHTQVYGRLALAQFSSQLISIEITTYDMTEPRNYEEVRDRHAKIIEFLNRVAERCKDMEKLVLRDNQVDNSIVRIIIEKGWYKLQVLELSKSKINHFGVSFLVKGKFTQLEKMNLDFNAINNKGVKALVGREWSHLRVLSLSGCLLTPQAIKLFHKLAFPKLKTLCLSYNSLFCHPLPDLVRTEARKVICFELKSFERPLPLFFMNQMVKSRNIDTFFQRARIIMGQYQCSTQIRVAFSVRFKVE